MKSVVALSGGLDSAVALANLLSQQSPADVLCVSLWYPSKHNRFEQAAACKIAAHYGARHMTLDAGGAFVSSKSSLVDRNTPLPEGHYEEESMRSTVVPGRNLIFLAMLAGVAENVGAKEVYAGVHAGDHFIYPDCRPSFVSFARGAIELSSDGKVTLVTPFLHKNKREIVELGHALKAPFHLTRTCYTEQELACGRCGSCRERREAFSLNGLDDPLPYQTEKEVGRAGTD
jgi:7-cyano-7-deazaguanine synthase